MFLSLLLWLPLVFAGVFFLLPNNSVHFNHYKRLAILFSFVHCVLSAALFLKYDTLKSGFQLLENFEWFPALYSSYSLGVDGVSVWMVFLTSLLTFIALLSSWGSVNKQVKTYITMFFLLECFTIGVFVSLDAILFYIFFEAVLIPMFVIIGIWGGKDKIYSSFKFFLYTLFGSLLFLVGLVYLISVYKTANIVHLQEVVGSLPFEIQKWVWLSFFLAFAIKVPMFPLHTWLPDAHVQAPTAGSVILAGVLIKMGAYGFLRFSIPMLPAASLYFQNFVIILSIIAVIYGSLIAIKQDDIKKMIAYSSVAHMGYVTAGLFALNKVGQNAAVVQMISHGLISGALFLSIGVIYERLHTRLFADFGGIASKMPQFAFLLMIFTMGSVGLPGTSGFVGEFMAILASFKISIWYAILLGSGAIFGAVYMLFMYRDTMFGEVKNAPVAHLKDINTIEIFNLSILATLSLAIGVYPNLVLMFL
jgi:NADH-quinone oxidoreductase subunit M